MKKIHGGDKGETCVIDKKVSKADLRIHAGGSIDELNSLIGLCRFAAKEKNQNEFDNFLEKIQEKLFVIGSELAAALPKTKVQIGSEDANNLEQKMSEYEKHLPQLKHFIFPSGSKLASLLHVARSICRRAERDVTALMQKEKINRAILVYLNRLSDLLFVMARLANKRENIADKEWVT